MKFDTQKYSYASRRTVSFAKNGMVATSSPLPAQVGLDILKKGGNAIDAAVATAAALSVMEPCSNGIGADSFALIWYQGKLYGLNGSGKSPYLISGEKLLEKGCKAVSGDGWDPVMVPGTPSAWAEAVKKFGKLSLAEDVEPAAKYAEEGFPLAPNIGKQFKLGFKRFMKAGGPERFPGWFATFAPEGKALGDGDIFRCEAMAKPLREIGATEAESFYRGAMAKRMAEYSEETGGWLRLNDFEDYRAEWVEPITTNYHGYDVFEMPPNGHGITVLMALNILKGFDLGKERETVDVYHKMIEAMKLAFVDGKEYVSDPKTMTTKVEAMLSEEYAAERRKLITDTAVMPEPGNPYCGGTVYLCTADGEGNMVSWIQSNYQGFGSGMVVPDLGVSFNDRGANFSLDPKSDNFLAPGKKAYHTIIPGFLCKDGKAIGPFGVMGGFMQPQGHLQVLLNTIDFGMNPQEALDAPRFQWVGGKKVQLERAVPTDIALKLAAMGHEIEIMNDTYSMGRGEIIWRWDDEVLCGAAEPRADGTVACY